MKVLLSIKPEYAFKIFDGSKLFEFRKVIFKNPKIKTVVVYASSPMQKVIGEFEIEHIINDDLVNLWQMTKQFAGIEEDYFYEYFSKKTKGFAIKIRSVTKYENPLCLKEDFKLTPPQSFLYIR